MQVHMSISAAVFALLLPLAQLSDGCEPPPPEGPTPRITEMGVVAQDVIELTVLQQEVELGAQVPYVAAPGDMVSEPAPPDNPHRYVTRDGEVIGALVGPDDDLLWTFDTLSGALLDTQWADAASSYTISSTTDPAFINGVTPTGAFRKSKAEGFAQVNKDNREVPVAHRLYLKLPSPLREGHLYTATFADGAFDGGTLAQTSFVFDPSHQRSSAVHVSQVGFRPADPYKLAYLSTWMGTGGPLGYAPGLAFDVIDEQGDTVVFSGVSTLQKAASEAESGSKNVNGTDVFQLDFSPLSQSGSYRVCVRTVGCSYPFSIGEQVWADAFRISASYLYVGRSGETLEAPYAEPRPRDHHPADPWVTVRLSTAPLMDTANGLNGDADGNFGELIDGLLPEDQVLGQQAWGGYHDAGDWDRRIQHLEASIFLIDLMEIFPQAFGGFELNIPNESGLPDLIEEARFQIDFYKRLQLSDGPDAGAVRGGIEHDAHPRAGEASWQDTNLTIAYAPDPWSSWLYAGTSAMLAHWMRQTGHPVEAADYERSARAAMDWAEAEDLSAYLTGDNDSVRDARNFAAAALFRLTGETSYDQIFLATTHYTAGPTANYIYGQRHGAWLYARTMQPGVNTAVRANCVGAYASYAADQGALAAASGFHWAKPKGFVLALGTFSTVVDSYLMARAHALTQDPSHLKALQLMVQTGTGANPLNLSYTTGVGANPVRNPLHVDTRMMGQAAPTGISVLGPADEGNPIMALNVYHRLVFSSTYDPPIETWPIIECYHDAYLDPLVTEFTVHQSIAPNLFAWGYLAGASP